MTHQSKRKAPAFQLYADDFLAGTMEMSQEEVGAYIRLLCHQWNRGSIPVETEKQQRLAGGSVSVDVLVKFPVGDDGLRRNQKLEQVRQNADAFHESQRKKGIASAEARKKQPRFNHGSTAVETQLQPKGQPKGNSPSPSPSPVLIPSGLPEGSGEQELPLTDPEKQKAPRKRNELLDALLSECGIENPTKTQFSMGNKFLAEIKAVDPEVTVQQIRQFCSQKRSEWRGLDFTPAAVAKHWKAPSRPGNGHPTAEATPENPFPGTGTVTLAMIRAKFQGGQEQYRWMMEMEEQGRFER